MACSQTNLLHWYLSARALQVLASVEVRAPRVAVLSNVTAAPFPSDPEGIRELLGRQLVEPVRCVACGGLGDRICLCRCAQVCCVRAAVWCVPHTL